MLVRDTVASLQGQGHGISTRPDPLTGALSSVEIRRSRIERSYQMGVLLAATDGVIVDSEVRDTLTGALEHGRGIQVQPDADFGSSGTLVLSGSLVTASIGIGVGVMDASGTIEQSVIERTEPGAGAQPFGDGLVVLTDFAVAAGTLDAVKISDSARAAIANFGSAVSIGNAQLVCQEIDLDGERYLGVDYSFENRGDTRCGCPAASAECRVLSSGLTPPTPLAPIADGRGEATGGLTRLG